MKQVLLILVLAILSNEAVGRIYRHKRQTIQDVTGPTTVRTTDANPTTARDQGITSTTTPSTDLTAVQACLRNCPVTSEYNPVCGNNGITYDNPSRLFCAQACGITVTLLRSSRCPPAPQPAS